MRSNLIAVYGSLRYGMHNNPVLGNAEYMTTSTVEGFDMYSFGGFPVLTPAEGGRVSVVELWRASDEEMEAVDCLEGFPHFYDRSMQELANGEVAWIYFMEYSEEISCLPYVHENDVGEQDWVLHMQEAA